MININTDAPVNIDVETPTQAERYEVGDGDHIADVVEADTGKRVGKATVVYGDRPDYPVSVKVGPLPAGYGMLGGSGHTVAEALARLIPHVPNRTHDNYIVVPIGPWSHIASGRSDGLSVQRADCCDPVA